MGESDEPSREEEALCEIVSEGERAREEHAREVEAMRAELAQARAERDAALSEVGKPGPDDLPTIVAALELARTEPPRTWPAARAALDRLTADHKRRSRAVMVLEAFFDHRDGADHVEAMAALALLRGG